MECLSVSPEPPRRRTFRSTSPIRDLLDRISPDHQPPHTQVPKRSKSHSPVRTHSPIPASFPSIKHSPFIRAAQPPLGISERLSSFSRSCNDLVLGGTERRGTGRRSAAEEVERRVLENGTLMSNAEMVKEVTSDGDFLEDPVPDNPINLPYQRNPVLEGKSGKKSDLEDIPPPPPLGYTGNEERGEDVGSEREGRPYFARSGTICASARNASSRMSQQGMRQWGDVANELSTVGKYKKIATGRKSVDVLRDEGRRSRNSPYEAYHSTKLSYIVPPRCITPINTTSLLYGSEGGSRTTTPTSDLILVPSRSPSPDLPPRACHPRRPSPPGRRPSTRTRSTSPIKHDDYSRCPSALPRPIRTSSPKPLLDRSISPLEQMMYVPGRPGTPRAASPFARTPTSPSRTPTPRSPSRRGRPCGGRRVVTPVLERDWSGYDSEGDNYRTANTSPEDGISWW